MLKRSELKAILVKGKDSRLQFKRDIRDVDAFCGQMIEDRRLELSQYQLK